MVPREIFDNREIMVYFASGHKAVFRLESVYFYRNREDDDLEYWVRKGLVVINMNAVSFIKRIESEDYEEDVD